MASFNSREYEWSDVTAVLGGRVITGIRGVEYKESLEKELLYGKGNKPRGIQHGNYAYDGKLSLLQSELDALQTACKIAGTSILEVRLNLVVVYGNPTKGDIIHTDVLENVEFTEVSKAMKQGDKFMEVELPFIFLSKKSI